jgi:alcohol dehydrogenase class IV
MSLAFILAGHALNSSPLDAVHAVGPALGGVLIAVVGVGWCLVFNALSFMAVLTMLPLTRTSKAFSPGAGGLSLSELGIAAGSNTVQVQV